MAFLTSETRMHRSVEGAETMGQKGREGYREYVVASTDGSAVHLLSFVAPLTSSLAPLPPTPIPTPRSLPSPIILNLDHHPPQPCSSPCGPDLAQPPNRRVTGDAALWTWPSKWECIHSAQPHQTRTDAFILSGKLECDLQNRGCFG